MPTSGYQTALNSPPYVAYNPGQNPITVTTANGTRFAFDSMTVAPAWRDNMIWYIYGYRAGTLAVYGSYVQQAFNKTTISCGTCSDLDTLYFTSSGGIPHPGLADNGTEFAFDDLCISFGY
jgi:hypothetical protein